MLFMYLCKKSVRLTKYLYVYNGEYNPTKFQFVIEYVTPISNFQDKVHIFWYDTRFYCSRNTIW